MTDLLSMLMSRLTGPILEQISALLGLPPDKAKSAVETIAGAILAGLVQKASTPSGAEGLFNALKTAAPNLPGADGGDIFGGLGDILGSPEKQEEIARKGTDLAGSILGTGKLTSILAILSKLIGLSGGTAGKLLGMLMPLILGQISKVVLGGGKGLGGLTDLLQSQKDSLAKLGLPSNLLGELGTQDLAAATGGPAKAAPGLPGRLVPALVIGVLALAGLYLTNSGSPPEPVNNGNPTPDEVSNAAPPVIDPPALAAGLKRLTLPDGANLDVPAGGLVDKLNAFLNDPNSDPKKAFAIDMATFAPGTANIAETAKSALELLAKLLNAFKGAGLTLTGYSDSTGSAEEQAARSTALPTAIKNALEQFGVDPARIKVEGKGAAPEGSERAKTGGVDIGINKS